METSPLYWLWLAVSLGYASRSLKTLIETFGDAETIYAAGEDELAEVKEITPADRKALLNKDISLAQEIANYCMHAGVGILTYADERYPQKLLDIMKPPTVLYYRGCLPAFDKFPAIGMVGARPMSQYGAGIAFETAYDVASMGCITVSGMALGIDGVCNAATLAAGGVTVAILGSGIDRVYPAEHKTLYKAIIEGGGMVVTEFHPYEKPDGFHFPLRNRLIAALSDSLVMVEGDGRSGALITARFAKGFNRTVYAVPGNIYERNSEGPLLLLQDGARILVNADAIYEEYKESHYGRINGFRLNEERKCSLEQVMVTYDVRCSSPKAAPNFERKQASIVEKRRKSSGTRTKEEKHGDYKKSLLRFFEKRGEKSEVLHVAQGEASDVFTDASFYDEELAITTRNEYVLSQLEGVEKAVFERLMKNGASQIEDIAGDDLSFDDVSTALVMMESEGYLECLPGETFRIKR